MEENKKIFLVDKDGHSPHNNIVNLSEATPSPCPFPSFPQSIANKQYISNISPLSAPIIASGGVSISPMSSAPLIPSGKYSTNYPQQSPIFQNLQPNVSPNAFPSNISPMQYPMLGSNYQKINAVSTQDQGEDQQMESLIRGVGRLLTIPVIFSATFSDGETLKQVFSFFSSMIDVCPFKCSKDKIALFKTKQSNSDSKLPSVIVCLEIDCDELYEYEFNLDLASHKLEGFHGFTAESSHLSDMAKNAKTNDIIKIIQYENEPVIRCIIVSNRSPAESFVNVGEYISEKCDFNSELKSQSLRPNVNILLNDFTAHCATLTKVKKIMAPINFLVHKNGVQVFSENRITPKREWGKYEANPHHFIFDAQHIKSLGMMKKFNGRGVVKFFAVDNLVLKIATSITSFGYIELYMINSTSL